MKKLIAALMMSMSAAVMAQVPNSTDTPIPLNTFTDLVLNSSDQVNTNYSCAHFIINVVTATSGTYTPHIQGKSPSGPVYYDILIGSAISSAGVTVLKVCPGIATLANGAASDMLPKVWRIQMIGASTPNMIFSVDVHMDIAP